jgi:hypothetical protein
MSPALDFLAMLALDGFLLFAATLRLVRFAIVDDLGRRALIPLESALRGWLSPGKQWVADGFTCPFCIGMWIGLLVVLTYVGADLLDGSWIGAWRLIFGALALNYVTAHLAARWDIYDDSDDQEAR